MATPVAAVATFEPFYFATMMMMMIFHDGDGGCCVGSCGYRGRKPQTPSTGTYGRFFFWPSKHHHKFTHIQIRVL
ncbi:hypothetical protein Hanom_Chr07g00588141 [Helianthus anomalus]